MASGLRAKLRAIGASAGNKPAPKRPDTSGVLLYSEHRQNEPGIFELSPVGLRRIGWSGRAFDIRKCLFLDTETTGLSGGAGTVAFLVGVGYVTDEGFVIEQYMMRDYAAEPEQLDRLASRMDDFDCVCTFNGRNFDMPLLAARFTMNRMRDRWRDLENLDLLHPARRVWKERLGSCRLTRLEELVLDLPRGEDLPGSEVPARWFAYLKEQDISLLQDIVDHNRQDIATLAKLLAELCRIYEDPENTLTERKDIFSVGKALEKQGELGAAGALYKSAAVPPPAGTLAAIAGDPLGVKANWRLYTLARRSGDIGTMESVLTQMLARRQMTFEVLIELSKLYEHRNRQFRKALRYATDARAVCPPDQADAVDKRIRRLRNRLETDGGRNNGLF